MKIDISRVNLIEKDIEDWLYENPDALYGTFGIGPIENWIGRQYQLPSGIADLIGVRKDGKLVVVEVKNVAINKAAVLQVCRYAEDLKYIVKDRTNYYHIGADRAPMIEKILVGPSIDDQTFIEALAVNVRVFQFAAELSLSISGLRLNESHDRKMLEQIERVAARPEWDIFGAVWVGDDEQHLVNEQDITAEEIFEVVARNARDYHDQQLASQVEDNDFSDIVLTENEDEEL